MDTHERMNFHAHNNEKFVVQRVILASKISPHKIQTHIFRIKVQIVIASWEFYQINAKNRKGIDWITIIDLKQANDIKLM